MEYIYVIAVIYYLNFFFALSFLLRSNYNLVNMSYLFIMVIMFPFLTPIIYYIHFNDLSINLQLVKKRKYDKEIFHDINDTKFYQNNSIRFFTNGNTFFKDLFQEIEAAKHFIHINFFIFKTDQIGQELIQKLENKLKENVEVKILYDQVGSKIKKKYLKEFKRLGGEILPITPLIYKPFFINVNYRNHRKIIIIDNKVSYIGGFNVGKEYVSEDEKMGLWVDSQLKIIGEATIEIEKRFLCDYAYVSKNPIDPTKYFIYYNHTGNKEIQVVSSGVDVSDINMIESRFIELIYRAKKYIYIETPYLILSDCMIHALKYASSQGVKIKIMIPNKKDHPFVLHATKAYAASLMDENISIYLFNKNAFLHSKIFVSDDEWVSIGTCNFDIRSFKYSLETNTYLKNQEFALEIKSIFKKQLTYCQKYTEKTVKNRSFFTKLKENFSKLISTIL